MHKVSLGQREVQTCMRVYKYMYRYVFLCGLFVHILTVVCIYTSIYIECVLSLTRITVQIQAAAEDPWLQSVAVSFRFWSRTSWFRVQGLGYELLRLQAAGGGAGSSTGTSGDAGST